MIKVLLVDDSLSTQFVLTHILESDQGIKVIARAANGLEALECIKRQKPDVITMDFHMPSMDGLEATRIIMETVPMPIIICSASWDSANTTLAFQFMDVGALTIIEKPISPKQADFARLSKQLIDTVKLMSEITVVKRRRNQGLPVADEQRKLISEKPIEIAQPKSFADMSLPVSIKGHSVNKYRRTMVVAIGASTGGPPAIKTILQGLPADFCLPILVVQHIADGFVPGFVGWLSKTTKLTVREAAHNEELLPANVYMAPAGSHMVIGPDGRIALLHGPPENGVKPAISVLFRSLAENVKADAVGVLLTGMGQDGAVELKLMQDAGALTIAQDQASCVVYGMPGEAAKHGAAAMILSPEQICETLIGLNKRALKQESQ